MVYLKITSIKPLLRDDDADDDDADDDKEKVHTTKKSGGGCAGELGIDRFYYSVPFTNKVGR